MENHWFPFTCNREFKKRPLTITKAEGLYFETLEGQRIIDGCSGLFCSSAGHGRPEIISAVSNQLQTLDYVPSFQVAHPLAGELADKIAKITPGDLNRVFFVNSGSESVDTALKVAMAYNHSRNKSSKQYIVSRQRAYHGVNIGGTSVGGMQKNRKSYVPNLMPHVVHMRHTWNDNQLFTRGQPLTGAELADDLLEFIALHGAENIGTCIVEPIAGSTGVLVPPVGYLERIRDICTKYDIVLIFDEVICGFGRLGHAFGAHAFQVIPDIMTMAKALTNGTQPMGAVAISNKIYESMMTNTDQGAIEFFHGYTFSAHPAACAAAIATLEIYEKDQLFQKAKQLSDYFLDSLFTLEKHDVVKDIRGYGLLGGIELHSLETPGLQGQLASKAFTHGGLHVKMTGDNCLIAPALIAEKHHIDQIVGILDGVLGELSASRSNKIRLRPLPQVKAGLLN